MGVVIEAPAEVIGIDDHGFRTACDARTAPSARSALRFSPHSARQIAWTGRTIPAP